MANWKPTQHKGLCVTTRQFGSIVSGSAEIANSVPPGVDEPWSGYIAKESVNTYIAVQGDFNQKAFGTTSCSPAEMGSWVGIGGVNEQQLIQVGTAMFKQGGIAKYYAWFEYISPTYDSLAIELPNVDVDPGDSIHLYTVHQRSTGSTTFYVHNNTNGTNQAAYRTLGNGFDDGTTAEHIAEAPGGTYLANFGNPNLTNAKVQLLSGDWKSLGSRDPDEQRSKFFYTDFDFHITADPDPMSSNTTFTDRWLRCN